MRNLETLPLPAAGDRFPAVIEASQGTRSKFKYQPAEDVFALSHVLPPGLVFPLDFGFLPSTRGEDGDPLDVLVFGDEPLPTGALVDVRIVGVIEAEQRNETDARPRRNDRILGVAESSHRFGRCRTLEDIGAPALDAIESFFVLYNRLRGRIFEPRGRRDAQTAIALIRAGERKRAEAAGASDTGPAQRGAA